MTHGEQHFCGKAHGDRETCGRRTGHLGPCLAVCGECTSGRCHWGGPVSRRSAARRGERCGCRLHASSVHAKRLDAVPTVPERQHLRAAGRMHRRPGDGVVVIDLNRAARTANRAVVEHLLDCAWLAETGGRFHRTADGNAALQRIALVDVGVAPR